MTRIVITVGATRGKRVEIETAKVEIGVEIGTGIIGIMTVRGDTDIEPGLVQEEDLALAQGEDHALDLGIAKASE